MARTSAACQRYVTSKEWKPEATNLIKPAGVVGESRKYTYLLHLNQRSTAIVAADSFCLLVRLKVPKLYELQEFRSAVLDLRCTQTGRGSFKYGRSLHLTDTQKRYLVTTCLIWRQKYRNWNES